MGAASHRNLCLIIIILLVSPGCQGGEERAVLDVEEVTLTAGDGLELKGTFYKGEDAAPGVVLLHMLGRDRRDWESFARALQKEDYNVLTIDLRGHGESDGNWQVFSETDFNNMVLDAAAARAFMEEKGIGETGYIGASIGANAALRYVAEDKDVRCIVLLSPGLDYRGLKTLGAAAAYGDRPLFIIASEEDEYSASSSRALYGEAGSGRRLQVLSGAGHGTRMFKDPQLEPMILNWLRDVGFR
jgi:pimeloyl-ACP methyl ester carboxylesterase